VALQIKTIKGKKYIYDVKSYWDKETKKYKKETIYMGRCLDEKTKAYAPKKGIASVSECKEILSYGDAKLLHESLEKSELSKAISEILPEEQDTLKALIFYKIIIGEANRHASTWLDGSYAKILFPNASLESQRISEFLSRLGDEKIQKKFFKTYLEEIAEVSNDVVIDSTGLPNEIDVPLTEYGSHGGDIQNESRMIMVIDRNTHMPLYFRLVAGNIVDVSTLTTTFSLMNKFGLAPQMVLMDAGYYSEKNIRSLFKSKTSFLTRLPAGRKLYKDLIEQTNLELESSQNAVVYNKRTLFIQKIKTEICGYVGFAYICLDPKSKGQQLDKFIKDAKEDKLSNEEIAKKMPCIGKFILVSDKEIVPDELLPLYYTRQIAENTFSFAKTNLNLLPIRVHSIKNMRGYIFLSYLALLISIEISNKLKGVSTLQEALSLAANNYCEVFDNDVIPLEANRQLKEIYNLLNIMVVNSSGE